MSKTKNILGVNVSVVNYASARETIFQWLKKNQFRYVCVAAVHLIMECWHNPRLRASVNQAGLVTPDGMPLVWLIKLGGEKHVERVYGPDLMLEICKRAAREKRSIFLLGGAAGQGQKLATVLKKRFSGLQVVGSHDTPIRPLPPQENQAVIKKINASGADFIFVGMGCPVQEQWMIASSSQLKKGVAVGVGAAFDFLTGRVRQAPRWMQAAGLEWLFRLAQEPRRLARRYLFWNPFFMMLIVKQYLTHFARALKTRKNKTWWLGLLLLGLVITGAREGWKILHTPRWQLYSEKRIGPNSSLEAYDNLVFADGLVFFNSQDRNTYALNQQSGTLAWQFTAQNYSPFPVTALGNRVYLANFDNTIYSLDTQTGREQWRFTIPNYMDPDTPVLASPDGTTVYFADRAGGLYALDAKSGEELWRKQFSAPDITTVFFPNTIHFGTLYVHGQQLYAVHAPSQAVFALELETGEVLWRVDNVPFSLTPPLFTNDMVVLSKTDELVIVDKHRGASYSIPRYGQIDQRWKAFLGRSEDNTLFLLDDHTLLKITLPTGGKQWHVDQIAQPVEMQTTRNASTVLIDNFVLVQKFDSLTYQNTVQAIDYDSGDMVWETPLPVGFITAALPVKETIVLGSQAGHLVALNTQTGEQVWEAKLTGKAIALSFHQNILAAVATDPSEKHNLFALDTETGNILWKYTPDYPVHLNHAYLTDQAAYVFDKDEHLIEKIGLTPSNPEQTLPRSLNFTTRLNTVDRDPFVEYEPKTPLLWELKKNLSQAAYSLTHAGEFWRYELKTNQIDNVLEFTLTHNEHLYRNPFTALTVEAVFTHRPTGQKTTIKGYYYDHNTWKLRFLPLESGEYNWRLTAKSTLGFRTWSGTEHLTKSDFQRLTVRDGEFVKGDSLFLPLGLQNVFADRNFDGNPINQISDSLLPQPGMDISEYRYSSLEHYFDLFKNEADINILRYGIDNWAPSLYQSLKPGEVRWNTRGGKVADTVLAELKKRDIHVMMTIFGFHPPYDSKEELLQPAHRKSLAHYLDYVIARYGAEVDLWEIGNEARSDEEWYRFVIEYIKAHDPYQRPVSMNWEDPDFVGSDYLSAHWYNEDTDSASRLSDAMQFLELHYEGYNQPILISEFGFKNVSWFPGSDSAVRILSWLTTFQKMGIIFWNQGQNSIYENPDNANVYLGPIERGYLQNLRYFLPEMTVPVTKDFFGLMDNGVKVFTLENNDYSLAYLLRVKRAGERHPRLSFDLDTPATVEWVNPTTGAIIKQENISAGEVTIIAPDFDIDIALKITYRGADEEH